MDKQPTKTEIRKAATDVRTWLRIVERALAQDDWQSVWLGLDTISGNTGLLAERIDY